ncbi:MAG: hypothetical protein JWM02_2629 [Frankiales bacterium]|nr:hypothetical protein [Frankiales bacterium]
MTLTASETPFATEAPAAPDGEATTDKRKLVVIGGIIAVVLAGGGWFLLGHSGGSSGPAMGLPAGGIAQPAVVKPAGKGVVKTSKRVVKPATLVPPVSTAQLGRDPFHALYVVPAAASTPGATTTTGSAPTGTSGGTTPTGTSTAPAQPTTYGLKLVRVYGSGKDQTAVFSVAGKTQLAKVGSVFGRTQEVKLLSVTQGAHGGWTATIQVGDGQPFDAPTGEVLYVQ